MALNPAQFAGYRSYEEALQGYANALSAPVPFKEWVVFANAVGRLYEDSPPDVADGGESGILFGPP